MFYIKASLLFLDDSTSLDSLSSMKSQKAGNSLANSLIIYSQTCVSILATSDKQCMRGNFSFLSSGSMR